MSLEDSHMMFAEHVGYLRRLRRRQSWEYYLILVTREFEVRTSFMNASIGEIYAETADGRSPISDRN